LVFRAYSDCQSRSDSAALLDVVDDMLRLQWIDVERELQNFERSLRE